MDKKIEQLIDAIEELIDAKTWVRGREHKVYIAETRERLRAAFMKVLENY